jgi:hypothetical protein
MLSTDLNKSLWQQHLTWNSMFKKHTGITTVINATTLALRWYRVKCSWKCKAIKNKLYGGCSPHWSNDMHRAYGTYWRDEMCTFFLEVAAWICEVILNSHMKCQTRSLWTTPHRAKPRPASPNCLVRSVLFWGIMQPRVETAYRCFTGQE